MTIRDDLRAAARALLVAVTDATDDKVIDAGAKGPRPAAPYVTVRVSSMGGGTHGPAERVDGLVIGYSLAISTATDGEAYGVSLTSPSSVAITYTAGVSSTPASIAAGLAAAWNANATTAAACAADGTTTPGTVTFTNLATRVPYALAEGANAGKMVLSAATSTPAARMQERREAVVSLQGYGSTAYDWLDQLQIDLDSPASLLAQEASDVSALLQSPVADLSVLLGTQEEARSSLELRLRYRYDGTAVAQVALQRAQVDLALERYAGDGDTLTVDFDLDADGDLTTPT